MFSRIETPGRQLVDNHTNTACIRAGVWCGHMRRAGRNSYRE